MSDFRENWADLERMLTALLAVIDPALNDRNRELLADFVDNREFEVAATWITSLVADGDVVLSDEAKQLLTKVKELMGV